MSEDLLSAAQAARCLGITVTTLYDWLGQSDRGCLVIRGQAVTIDYMQGGAKGQGRIRIEPAEVQQLKELLRVHPKSDRPRRIPIRQSIYPGITVPLGMPPR